MATNGSHIKNIAYLKARKVNIDESVRQLLIR